MIPSPRNSEREECTATALPEERSRIGASDLVTGNRDGQSLRTDRHWDDTRNLRGASLPDRIK